MTRGDRMFLIYTTFETDEQAREAGGQLVDERLAACVNIIPGMISIYEWQGERQNASEVVMIVKTRAARIDDALATLKRIHPYETPALFTIEPASADPEFEQWICSQTAG